MTISLEELQAPRSYTGQGPGYSPERYGTAYFPKCSRSMELYVEDMQNSEELMEQLMLRHKSSTDLPAVVGSDSGSAEIPPDQETLEEEEGTLDEADYTSRAREFASASYPEED